MRMYPQLARPRNRQLRRDLLVLAALALCGLLAWAVRAAVLTLTTISSGFTDSAQSAEAAWDSVGSVLAGVPFLGSELQRSAQELSVITLGSAAQTGASITEAVQTTADVLAVVTFAAPAAVLLVLWLPRRLDRARAWSAADRVLPLMADPSAAEAVGVGPARLPGAELLALRALCCLPFVELLRYCPSPFESYASGDYAPLIRALYEREGLVSPL